MVTGSMWLFLHNLHIQNNGIFFLQCWTKCMFSALLPVLFPALGAACICCIQRRCRAPILNKKSKMTPQQPQWEYVLLQGAVPGPHKPVWVPFLPLSSWFASYLGKIPGSAVLVFDIQVVDFHNPSDSVSITVNYKPSNCTVLSKKGDYLKYHYNASLLDGTLLDST